ncbi:hypothetical protein, partial [Bacteroides salyersiae]|uniref:hypothetical protein n=1 Tax=Bacteroides salyersiae TaxID=291644 RepID=UPI001960A509
IVRKKGWVMLFLFFGSMDFGVENIVQLSALLIAWLSVFCFCYFFLYEERLETLRGMIVSS